MGLKIERRKRGGRRSVATGSRGGTHGYSSGPLPTKKKGKNQYTDPATKRKVVDLGSSM